MPVRDLRVRMLGEDETGPAYRSAADNADRMATATTAAWTAAAAGVGVFVLAMGEAFDQESLGDRTAAALALTGPQAEQAGRAAGELFGNAYTDSADEANLAVESVMSSIAGMRDASAGDIEAVAGAALNLSNVMGVEVARSAQVAGQLITNGLAADGREAFDLLIAGSQQVPTAIRGDLVDAVDEYGQFFAQLGYSGEQAMALLVDASAQGMYGIDKTGDAIKELTIRATDMSASSTAAYEAIGLDAQTMANRMLAGGATAQEATQQIITGLLGMSDPAEQAQAAIALFGTPLEDLNAGEIPAFLGSLGMMNGELEGVAGTAERFGEQLTDNASSRFQAWRQAAQQSVVEFLGNQVIPRIEMLTTWVGQNGDRIQSWATVIGAVLLPVLALWGTAATINAAKNVAAWVTTALASGTSATTQSLSAGQVVLAWVVAGTQSLIQGARMAAAWLIAMGPVGWVIAAVVGLVALIVANWDTVVAWTRAAWSATTGAVSAAWEWIKNAAATGAQWVMDRIAWFGQIPGRVSSWFGSARDAAVARLGELVGWLTGLPGQVLSAIGNFGSLLYNAGRDLLRGLWNGISGAAGWLWQQVRGWANNLMDNVLGFFGIASPSRVFAEIGGHLMGGLAMGIDDGAGDAVSAAVAAASRVTDAAQVSASIDPALAGSMGMPIAAAGGVGGVGAGGAGAMSGGDAMSALLAAIRDLRDRPTVGQVVTQRDETGEELAERLAFMARTGG